jgi:hypothetical protein
MHQAERFRISRAVRSCVDHLVYGDTLCACRDLQAEGLEHKERLLLRRGAREIGVRLGNPDRLADAAAAHHPHVVRCDIVDLLGFVVQVKRRHIEPIAVCRRVRLGCHRIDEVSKPVLIVMVRDGCRVDDAVGIRLLGNGVSHLQQSHIVLD